MKQTLGRCHFGPCVIVTGFLTIFRITINQTINQEKEKIISRLLRKGHTHQSTRRDNAALVVWLGLAAKIT